MRWVVTPLITAAFVLSAASQALAGGHRLLVINAGSEAIFELRTLAPGGGSWSADLLGFDGVIDVSRGQDVTFDVASGCTYDVLARYKDGHEQVLRGVDLCNARELRFDH